MEMEKRERGCCEHYFLRSLLPQ